MSNEQVHPQASQADLAELATLYAAGALTPEEAAAFERRLAAGCEDSHAELNKLAPVVKALAACLSAESPSECVREALLARVQQCQTSESSPAGEG